MFYILYLETDKAVLEEEILPLLKNIPFQLELFSDKKTLDFPKASKLISYLPDLELKYLLLKSLENNWQIGVLPHPELHYIQRGLGTSSQLEKSLQEILSNAELSELDLLLCNDKPVLQSLKTGDVFLIDEEKVQSNLLIQIFRIIKNIWNWSNISHEPYNFSQGENKIINTSALGLIILAQAGSYSLNERSKSMGSVNNGFLNLLVIAPQSILEMLFFLIKGTIPGLHKVLNEAKFIGYLKVKEITIQSARNFNYTIDGEKYNAESISLEVKPKAIKLLQKSIFFNPEKITDKNTVKNSLKIEGLPTGEKKDELVRNKMTWLPRATSEEFRDLFVAIRENAKSSNAFLVLMALSTIMATFGLYGNSSPVIIGAMILAPLMSPIISFSMAVVRYDVSILKTSVKTILAGTLLSLFFAAFVSILIPLQSITPEIAARLSPTLLDLGIAVAAGIAGAYAHSREEIAKSLAGVAIAVALVPPLAVAGIGIGWLDISVFSGAFLLYLTNLAGIIMSAGLTFLLLGFAPFTRAKRGLIYSFIILLIICIPLSISFYRIKTEAEISKKLEGHQIDNVVLKNISVRPGEPIHISLRLVSPKSLSDKEMKAIKKQIESILGREIQLEAVSAIVF